MHYNNIHLQLRPYKCKFCDLTFAKHGTLKDHQMRHTGEKAFHCEFCGKGFIQRAPWKAHRKTHLAALGGAIPQAIMG